MANTTSAKKATRKIARRTDVNKARRSRVRTFVRKVEEAIASGDAAKAKEAFLAAQPELARAGHRYRLRHLSENFGLRFSMKAAMPSAASAV